MDYSWFEKKIGIEFKDKSLLKQAFTHRSYINENKNSKTNHNERLEFLGDAVLELVITDYLFKKYPKKNEGELTTLRSAIVNTNVLSESADKLKFNDFLVLSKGEARDTGRARYFILANAFEAVIGAIYLDQGYDAALKFIGDNLFGLVGKVESTKSWQDSKSLFQEKAQEFSSITPNYKTIDESGPDHDKVFVVGVYLDEELVAKGKGKSKQEAQQEAAKLALEKKGW
jgi:ribonuclease-3